MAAGKGERGRHVAVEHRDQNAELQRRRAAAAAAGGPITRRTDWDVLKSAHRFLRDDEQNGGGGGTASYDAAVASKLYAQLFKEYALADLKHYRSGDVALRWRTEQEVLGGVGQDSCGGTRCVHHAPDPRASAAVELRAYEMDFAYMEPEDGASAATETPQMVRKNAVVKVVLCRKCARKLNYKHDRKREAEAGARKGRTGYRDKSSSPRQHRRSRRSASPHERRERHSTVRGG